MVKHITMIMDSVHAGMCAERERGRESERERERENACMDTSHGGS